MKLATAEQMRELDKRAIREREIPSIDLMEAAAGQVAEAALAALPERTAKCPATVFCGSGNNGGDGIGAARRLFLSGVRVRVFLVGKYERLTPDALEETRRLSECGVELEPFDPENKDQRRWALQSQAIVDAIFGVGLSRDVEEGSVYAAAIDLINRCKGAVIAADIPSGVEADTGRVLGRAVRADRTVTFTLAKVGHFVGDGALLSGAVAVRDIGIPRDLVKETACTVQTVERDFAAWSIPVRRADGHKGTFGKLLIAGGSVGYTGAPYLTASAAVRSGCGLVYLAVPKAIWAVEAAKCGSAMPFPLPGAEDFLDEHALPVLRERLRDCGVLALGPGLGRDPATAQAVRMLLSETELPVVLDADGINALEGHMDVLSARQGRVTILTPHDGEFERLAPGALKTGDRTGAARDFARQYGCYLVLKGCRTITAAPAGNLLVNTTGNSGLAKGGSGDVLTGLIASLLAQGAAPIQAAAGGVWLHGRAGDLAAERLTAYGMTPEDVVAGLPGAFSDFSEYSEV